MPILALHPATPPVDTAFPPPSAQALLNFVAAYTQVTGLESITGVVVGSSTPSAADRDKVWLKLDPASSRALGLQVFNGEWTPIPVIVPAGEAAPASARAGELFYNVTLKALQVYTGSEWTTNLQPTGDRASRPSNVPVNYLYLDTEIGRLLRSTPSGWTTLDGGVGDIKMVDFSDPETALRYNPGWSVFAALNGRFPLGFSDTYTAQSEGGTTLDQMQLRWAAQGRSASGGSREATASFIAALKINDVEKRADGTKYDSLTSLGSDQTINLTPPYRAMIFLRKDY
jgi:hypothetical protein